MISKNPLIRWSGYVGIAVVFALLCVFLSDWQFDRNGQRSAEIELVEQNYDRTPIAFSDAVPADREFDERNEWLPVILEGEYLYEQQILARNRPRGGTSAFEILVPFQLADGRIVIVNRGWLPPGEGTLPDVIPSPAAGHVTVTARLRPSEQLPRSGRSAPEGQVPTINLELIAATTGPTTVTSVYALMVTEDPAAASVPNRVDPPGEDPGPHLSYAIQWILFAIMGFVFIAYVIKTERRQRREDAGEVVKPLKKRRDADADHEDALLDA